MKIIEWLIDWFTPRSDYPDYATGVLNEKPDYRNIPLVSVQAPIDAIPDTFLDSIPTFLKIETLNQKYLPFCVPHAFVEGLIFEIFKVTGEYVNLSPRFLAKICKFLDGFPNAPGTFPRIGALALFKYGCAKEDILKNDTDMDLEEYLGFTLTDEMLRQASNYKIPGFAFVQNDIDHIKQAIYQNGFVCGVTPVGDWTSLPVLSRPFVGDHYTNWIAYEAVENGNYKIYFKNSWGSGWLAWLKKWLYPGYGYFLWSEYKNQVHDIIAITRIPDDYLKKVTNMPFKFTKEMQLGMNHPQVRELQKFLNLDPETSVASEGSGSYGSETTYFGKATEAALIKWQQKHNIEPAAGYFGPKSMAEANKRIFTSTIDLWALAIQKHEGYFIGSRSYKNKNPGNIRYTGFFVQLAKGQDDKGFCIFDTYNQGFDALKTLLVRACNGLSSSYSPDDTLRQFFRKYAPVGDNNDPDTYATNVAKDMGVSVDTKIKTFVL